MHDDEVSTVTQEFAQALMLYVGDQGTCEDRDEAELGQPPHPDRDSPMLKYLIQRAAEIAEYTWPTDPEGVAAAEAFVWLAVHAWFEGGLAERARARS